MSLNIIKKKEPKVSDAKVPCMRCKGRKKMYKVGSGYTRENTGGKKIDCPMCLGVGKIKPISTIMVTDKDLFIDYLSMPDEDSTKEHKDAYKKTFVEALNKATEDVTRKTDTPKTKTELKSKGGSNAKKESRTRKA